MHKNHQNLQIIKIAKYDRPASHLLYCITLRAVYKRESILLACPFRKGQKVLSIQLIFILQVDNIGFLMAHVFLPHKTFPPWVYQVL